MFSAVVISHREAILDPHPFPDNDPPQDPRRNSEIDWYHPQSGAERVLTLQYAVIRDGANHGTEAFCDGGSNDLYRKDLGHSLLASFDAICTKCGYADADNAIYDAVSEERSGVARDKGKAEPTLSRLANPSLQPR